MSHALPAPGAHGGDGARIAAALGLDPESILDLSLTLNPVATDPVPIVRRAAGAIRRYPDTTEATALLAERLGVDRDQVLLTNGGSEAIALVAAELGAGRVDDPDFSLYRRHLPVIDPAGPRWRSNPHSPTGRLAGPDDRAAVWDEAFFPLAGGSWTRGDAAHGAIVVGSLTKALACPGLRAGYVLASEPDLVRRLARRQPRWSVGSLVLAALPELLAAADPAGWTIAIAELRRQLVDVLRRHGWRPEPSEAPWVLVAAPGLRDALAHHGVVVRDCASFGLPGVARIAVPDADGLARLDAALAHLDPPREAE